MPNPEIHGSSFIPIAAPPIAPPAQPGEYRACFNCTLATGFEHLPGRLQSLCSWREKWDKPFSGCDRWALTDSPIASPMPGAKDQAPLVYNGKGRKRSFR